MNNEFHFSRGRRRRISPEQRAALLAAFECSGQTAAAFAREHGVRYTTFCSWRSKASGVAATVPGFLEVELPQRETGGELVIELGGQARLRVGCEDHARLAACVLARLMREGAC